MKPCDPITDALLAQAPWVRTAAPFALVRLVGADAGDFLQRLCSQDVVAMAPGAVAPAAFLDAKGKVVATCLVARRPDGFALAVQATQTERLLGLLERFHFTEKVQVALSPGVAAERISRADGAGRNRIDDQDEVVVVAFARRGVQFERWHAPRTERLPGLAGRALDDATAAALRMGAGIVAVGIDTEASTLALEADLDDHCSTTKGCYTGQEIVARIHTYGHINRGLCLLHLAVGPAIDAPQILHEPDDDQPVGRVMHAVSVPGQAARVGLGYLPADFRAVGTALRLADGTAVTVAGFAS